MKKKFAKWLLETAHRYRGIKWYMPLVLGVVVRMGLVRESLIRNNYIYYDVLPLDRPQCIRLELGRPTVLFWYDEDSEYFFGDEGGILIDFAMMFFEDALFSLSLKPDPI